MFETQTQRWLRNDQEGVQQAIGLEDLFSMVTTLIPVCSSSAGALARRAQVIHPRVRMLGDNAPLNHSQLRLKTEAPDMTNPQIARRQTRSLVFRS